MLMPARYERFVLANFDTKGKIVLYRIENPLLLVIDFQVRLMQSIHNHEVLERKAAALIKGCHILGMPILTTQQYTKGLGDTIPALKEALCESPYIEKITFSCCGNSEFIDKLNASKKNNILVTGVEAHICVQQTVLDLLAMGNQVYVIADCIGSRSERDYTYGIERMRQSGAVITTMESVLFEFLQRADHPKRKEISNLVK